MITRRIVLVGVLGFYALFLAGCASSAPLEKPTVNLGGNGDERILAMVDCLTEAGWEVDYDELTRSYGNHFAEGQIEPFTAAQAECRAGLDEPENVPFSDQQLSEIYEYELWLAQCLRGEGLSIPEAPTEQVFAERYVGTDPWFAWRFVEVGSEGVYRELLEACPQL